MISISQIRVLRLEGIKIQDYPLRKWQSWDSNPGQLTQAMLLDSILNCVISKAENNTTQNIGQWEGHNELQ